jgi:hypothetical protein
VLPCSKLLALSEQLLELDAALQRRVSAHMCEMEGAFVACQINSTLAPILTLSSSTAFRLALPMQLILRYGGGIMQHHTDEALSSKQYGSLANNAACQIATINRIYWHLVRPGAQPNVAAAFSNTAAPPRAVLACLATAADALMLAIRKLGSPSEGAGRARRMPTAVIDFYDYCISVRGWLSR